jgi:hypothetical protein
MYLYNQNVRVSCIIILSQSKNKFQKEWDRALQSENDAIAFEYLSGDELVEYFKGSKKND